MTKSEQSTGLGVVGVAGWRTDAPPMDGTVIYRRVMQPYRYLPYKPNSQQAKRGEAGRWQMMNEYGGWDNCPHPLGNEWSLEHPFLSSAPSMTPTTHPATDAGSRWRVFKDITPGYWGIELEQASNDDDAIMYPIKIHRDTVTRIVDAHNAALTAPEDRQ